VYRAQAGHVTRAVSQLEEVLREQQRVLLANHPQTLNTRRNLALWRKMAGNVDVTDAIGELEEVLREHRRVVGGGG
jgi:hypothetical protein